VNFRLWSLTPVAVLIAAGSLPRLEAQTLQAIASSEPPRVQIFLSGNLRDVVGQTEQGAQGTGALGMRYIGPAYVATGLINVAGAFDTVGAGFGGTMLPPSTGRGLNAGVLDIRRRYLFGHDNQCRRVHDLRFAAESLRALRQEVPDSMRGRVICSLGLHTYLGVSTSRWGITRDPVTDTVTSTIDVPVWGAGLGLSYTFIDDRLDNKDLAMVLDVGLATRNLRGDLAADRRSDLRESLLGTDRRNFYGLEMGLAMQYENVGAALTYYFFGSDVDGLSHGQVVAGVSIHAALNDWFLGRRSGTPAATNGSPADGGAAAPDSTSANGATPASDTTPANETTPTAPADATAPASPAVPAPDSAATGPARPDHR